MLAMGRSCIDLYAHQTGVPITAVTSYDAYVGGCPTNVIVGSSRLGLKTALLTAVGDDQVADFVIHFLRRERVETRFIPRKEGRRTSAVIVTIRPPDDFPLTFYRDNCADDALTIADVERSPIDESRVVFVTGTGMSRESSRTATLWAAEKSRRLGASVVLDIDYRAVLWPDAATFGSAVRAGSRGCGQRVGSGCRLSRDARARSCGRRAEARRSGCNDLAPGLSEHRRAAVWRRCAEHARRWRRVRQRFPLRVPQRLAARTSGAPGKRERRDSGRAPRLLDLDAHVRRNRDVRRRSRRLVRSARH